jgi:predicted O-linked N-acetylglucosamine transferase (SPINDLY family)
VIDYFVSYDHFEREDGESEYSEKLIKFASVPGFYAKPKTPQARERADYELPEDRTLYACPQMAYKFHPDFDRVLAEILGRDPKGVLVLIEPQHGHYKQILLNRWASSFPEIVGRVCWLPQMSLPAYLALLPLCDALLAPIQFGGGRSTYDALGVGAPVVTYRGEFLKSRITHALYREAGIEGLTATSENEYVDIALRLGQDADWRAEMRRQVVQKAGALFDNPKAVAEFNQCLGALRS